MMKAPSELSADSKNIGAPGFLANCRMIVDRALDDLVPTETDQPIGIHCAMRWSLFAGGKRLRPALVLAVGEAFGASVDDLIKTACAIELIHTYSLVHDDLPSMDNDDLRRGRPTCHVQFDEATAILAGDALQALAFEILAEDQRLPPLTRVRVIGEIASAAGTPRGMVAGQAYDLYSESRKVEGADLEKIHRLKTGALICASARVGAIIAGAGEDELNAITSYGANLGLLFQITDDLLDVTSSAEDLGKTPGKDVRSSKATYPALYGLESTRKRARETYQNTRSALAPIKKPTDLLLSIAEFILERRK